MLHVAPLRPSAEPTFFALVVLYGVNVRYTSARAILLLLIPGRMGLPSQWERTQPPHPTTSTLQRLPSLVQMLVIEEKVLNC